MSDRTHAPGHPPPGAGDDHAHAPRWGGALFTGLTGDGTEVTLVCSDDGYGLRLNGEAVPGRHWGADQVDGAVTAYWAAVGTTVRLVIPPPAE